tara:strand:+ start:279 stop:836 length:558 start_codon:yes stop_codon:yes gene_type:complete
MIKQNIAIFRIHSLYKILKELEIYFNYKAVYVSEKNKLNSRDLPNYLILTNDEIKKDINQLKVYFPLKIKKLIEKINIHFLKLKTKENSKILLGDYEIDLNSRVLKLNFKTVNLTEREINLIMFLNNSSKPVKVQKLQSEVWSYKFDLESHTVETHIHRLRKKILKNFNRDNFILSDKNGYYLKK